MTVIDVVDGDTLKIRYQNGTSDTVRLLGVDTPEVHSETNPDEFEGIPDTESGREWLSDWGDKASSFVTSEVNGEEITIRTDDQADTRGSYGRLLAYVYHDGGEHLNRQLLDQGYARLYESSFEKRETFASEEDAAQANDVGVWGYEEPATATPTQTPESGTGESLAVADIHPNAEGNDHNNLNDEYVVFENTGDQPIDLSGWTVTDEGDNHRYVFPDRTLDPGARVTLYTGSGSDSETELYWGESQAVWNNGGDTVHVTNAAGETIIEYTYDG